MHLGLDWENPNGMGLNWEDPKCIWDWTQKTPTGLELNWEDPKPTGIELGRP